MSTGTDTLVQFIVAVAGTGGLVAVVQGLFTRRKTRAEVAETGASATKVITDAAAVLVSNVNADNADLRAQVLALRKDVDRLQLWREAAERNFDRHERWDKVVTEAVRSCSRDHGYLASVDLENPPPLRPTL